jgi:hypothetical protein
MTRLAFVLSCVLSGFSGAVFLLLMQGSLNLHEPTSAKVLAEERKPSQDVVRARRLELIDTDQKVRAIFSVEDSGNVSLRMLSTQNVPIIELRLREAMEEKIPRSIGIITVRDDSQIPLIQLGTGRRDAGALLFSSPKVHGLVDVGYQEAGDVVDGHEHGFWGVEVKGQTHSTTAMGVRTEDGAAQGFVGPQRTSAMSIP